MPREIYTFGHSTLALADFLAVLAAHEIRCIADVRRFPASRRYPHFNAEALKQSLAAVGIGYFPAAELGGRRKPVEDSRNDGWRSLAFRGYADFMQSEEFLTALAGLEQVAETKRTAMLCAEAVPWRCHRSLIGDALLVRGWKVWDIFDRTTVKRHQITPFAVVSGLEIVYPPEV
jgi:uncharacterized protein (DUF488 family)